MIVVNKVMVMVMMIIIPSICLFIVLLVLYCCYFYYYYHPLLTRNLRHELGSSFQRPFPRNSRNLLPPSYPTLFGGSLE